MAVALVLPPAKVAAPPLKGIVAPPPRKIKIMEPAILLDYREYPVRMPQYKEPSRFAQSKAKPLEPPIFLRTNNTKRKQRDDFDDGSGFLDSDTPDVCEEEMEEIELEKEDDVDVDVEVEVESESEVEVDIEDGFWFSPTWRLNFSQLMPVHSPFLETDFSDQPRWPIMDHVAAKHIGIAEAKWKMMPTFRRPTGWRE